MGEANRRGSLKQRQAEAIRSGRPVDTSPAEFASWLASQTRKRKPAVMLVQGDEPSDSSHAYLANADAFGMPVIAALNVPRDLLAELGANIDFLHRRHTTGHPVTAGQVSLHELEDGMMLHLRITEPSEEQRRALLADELRIAGACNPDSRVLLLEPMGRSRKETVH